MQYLVDEFEKSLPPMGHPLRKLGVRLTELLDEDQWAECERLLLECWEHDAADRATGARKELAEAQKNAERYDFLAGFGLPAHSPRWARWRIERWTKDGWSPIHGNLMSAAIDAAMGEPS